MYASTSADETSFTWTYTRYARVCVGVAARTLHWTLPGQDQLTVAPVKSAFVYGPPLVVSQRSNDTRCRIVQREARKIALRARAAATNGAAPVASALRLEAA